jgi:hypothetical protein
MPKGVSSMYERMTRMNMCSLRYGDAVERLIDVYCRGMGMTPLATS